jgi:hypothetical protein
VLKSRCPQASASIDQLEQEPDSKARRVAVEKDLTNEGAGDSAEIRQHAKTLLDVIAQRVPTTADVIGVSLADIQAASLRIGNVLSSGSGVVITEADISSDINIENVQAGQQGGNHPNR